MSDKNPYAWKFLTRSCVCKQVSVTRACVQSLLKIHLHSRVCRNLYPSYPDATGRQWPPPCTCKFYFICINIPFKIYILSFAAAILSSMDRNVVCQFLSFDFCVEKVILRKILLHVACRALADYGVFTGGSNKSSTGNRIFTKL